MRWVAIQEYLIEPNVTHLAQHANPANSSGAGLQVTVRPEQHLSGPAASQRPLYLLSAVLLSLD